jgi:2-methylcitrate dehydratase PrpD
MEVDTFAYAASLSAMNVRSDLHARFSLPVCLATLALDGELHTAGFLPRQLARPEVAALASRVVLREAASFTAALPRERPTTVTVTWDDGEVTSAHVRNARGNPDNPLSNADVSAKFLANVETVLPPELAGDCVRIFLDGADTAVLAEVARLLS